MKYRYYILIGIATMLLGGLAVGSLLLKEQPESDIQVVQPESMSSPLVTEEVSPPEVVEEDSSPDKAGDEGTKEQAVVTTSKKEAVQLEQRRGSFIRPADETLPQEVRNWVENSLKFDLTDFANAKEFDGKQYLFVRSGIGGFRGERLIQIIDVIVEQEEVVVKVKFIKPSIAQQIPDNLYDLVYIEATGLQARFVPIADEAIFITSLTGIHYLPDIVAQSLSIKVFAPAPNEVVVEHKFSVSGAANVFEATILYRLLDVNQNMLDGGFTTALQLAPDFTRETVIPHSVLNWRYFTFNLKVPENVVSGENLTLELYWLSPKEGEGIRDLVAIPLKFELR